MSVPQAIASARFNAAVACGVSVAAPDDNRNNNARLPQAGD